MNIKRQVLSLFVLSFMGLAPSICISQDAVTQGSNILENAISEHGGSAYETAHYAFVFRGKTYLFHNQKEWYSYSRSEIKDGQSIVDKMDNDGFVRTINGIETELDKKKENGYKEGLNSVIYFASLPYKLQDKAVNALYIGEQKVKGQNYDLVQVTFDQEGGGKDHDDTFMYWIHQDKNTMDFLAYSYHVSGGGVRFRAAYNPRREDGILFQDYINYKAEVGTSLEELSGLWEADKLKELSRIETEKVKSLRE